MMDRYEVSFILNIPSYKNLREVQAMVARMTDAIAAETWQAASGSVCGVYIECMESER